MRKAPNEFKLMFTLILFFAGGEAFAQQVPAQDEATQREMESRKQLELMNNAPPAPMPPSANTRTEAESASEESRSTVSYDPVTGKKIVQPAVSPSGSARVEGAAPKAPVQAKKGTKDGI